MLNLCCTVLHCAESSPITYQLHSVRAIRWLWTSTVLFQTLLLRCFQILHKIVAAWATSSLFSPCKRLKITLEISAHCATSLVTTIKNLLLAQMLWLFEHKKKIWSMSSIPPSHRTQWPGQFTPLSRILKRHKNFHLWMCS
jgi:hypothetical protein